MLERMSLEFSIPKVSQMLGVSIPNPAPPELLGPIFELPMGSSKSIKIYTTL